MQVKTNEDDNPWDPKPEDQKVDGSAKLYKEGIDQLDRDALRFLELTPDIKMTNLKIVTNVAFPLAQESSDRALTNNDLRPENAKVLLEKLGVPKKDIQPQQGCISPAQKTRNLMAGNLTAEVEETYKKVVCRYLGAHSKVSTKIDIDAGLEPLQTAIKGTEGGFKAQTSDSKLHGEEEIKSIRKAVTTNPQMNLIQRAVLIPKFGKRFQRENPNIPLKDLKSDSKRFLKQLSTNRFPLFGLSVIRAVIRAADNDVAHQGAEAITELLEKEKYLFYDENGHPLDLKTTVDEYIQVCRDCSKVQEIRNKVPQSKEENLLQIPEALEEEVLLFADRRHLGFAEAYRRVKSWASFPDHKRKVLHCSL